MTANRPISNDKHFLAVWSSVFHDLKDTDFADDDIADWAPGRSDKGIEMAYALQYVYDKMDDGSDAILAALIAAKTWRDSAMISPIDIADMADHFAAYFGSQDDALDEHLRENYPGVQVEWLNEKGRQAIKDEMIRDSEIWVDSDKLPGVWVFNKPGNR